MTEEVSVYTRTDVPTDPAACAETLLTRAADRLREIETELAEKNALPSCAARLGWQICSSFRPNGWYCGSSRRTATT